MRTDDLIRQLAADLPQAAARARARPIGLLGAGAAALAITLPVSLWLYGLRAGGPAEDMLGLLVWLAAASGALWAARHLARPEPPPILALWGPPALLVIAVPLMAWAGQQSETPVFRTDHMMHCAEAIGLLSLGPFLWLTYVMRRGAPASPRTAGAIVGLVAGAIGAFAYTLSCPIDSNLTALSAHTSSVLLVTALGALAGPVLMRW